MQSKGVDKLYFWKHGTWIEYRNLYYHGAVRVMAYFRNKGTPIAVKYTTFGRFIRWANMVGRK